MTSDAVERDFAGQRPVEGIVGRAKDRREAASRRLLHVPEGVLRELGEPSGSLLEVRTTLGRGTVARVEFDPEVEPECGVVLMDRFLRQTLKVRLDERVTLRSAANVGPAERVVLASPVDLSRARHFRAHIEETLRISETPCSRGATIYVPLPHSAGGMLLQIVEAEPENGVFAADTSLTLESEAARQTEGASDVTFEDVGGLSKEIQLLRELVQLPLQLPFVYRELGVSAPRGVILYGPPGCGKTELARAVSNEVAARFYYIDGPSVVGTMQGETEANLRKVFNEAAHHAPSIVVIDELDSITPHRDDSGSQSNVRAVTTLLSLMDGLRNVDGMIVIGTTNRIDAVDRALRRPGRFDREMYIAPPDATGRYEILQIHCREMPLTSDASGHLKAISEHAHGYVGADLKALCREAGLHALRRSAYGLSGYLDSFGIEEGFAIQVDAADFDDALRDIGPSALREFGAHLPTIVWSEIAGLDAVEAQLRRFVERPLRNIAAFVDAGLAPLSGIVLHGPPGTGKTLLVEALANGAKVNLIRLDGASIFSKWVGQSEEAVRHIFATARQLAPTIVFLDQLDAIAPARGSGSGTRTTERVVNQLVAELDAAGQVPGIVVIAATNRLDLVDSAVIRPGRLGTPIAVPLPDESQRAAIARLRLSSLPLARGTDAERLAQHIAQVTGGLSGADICGVLDQAKLAAHLDGEDNIDSRDEPAILQTRHILMALEGLAATDPCGTALPQHEPALDGDV